MRNFLSNRRWLIAIGVFIIILGLWFWRKANTAPTYDAYTSETRNLTETIELSGKVQAGNLATLRFPAGGLLTYLGAQEGESVKKWQTLASLDTRSLHKVLEQKLNLYAIQRNTFDQTIDDNDNSIPDGDLGRELKRLLAKNQYQLENTVKDVEYQDLAIRLSRLYSPIEGILVSSPASVPHVTVAATDTWVVVDPGSLEFIADLDETDLARVQVGQKVIVTLDAFEDLTLESTISQISYSPKETTTGTTYEVTIPLSNYIDQFRLGLNGTAKVELGIKEGVVTLPASAISIEPSGTLVYLKEGNDYLPQLVTLGIDDGEIVEIKSGLTAGVTVYAKNSN